MREPPLIMGILNVTPDSFSDGGRYFDSDRALCHAVEMVQEGADIIDVGGESTRPRSVGVSVEEELERTVPVIQRICRELQVRVSIDTSKAEVAAEAIRAGATLVNDVTAGQDVRMAMVVAESNVDVILMHMQGTPLTMQGSPQYPKGVVTEVREYLEERVRAFHECGVGRDRVWVDPGIGFGKTVDHNLELLKHLDEFLKLGRRVVIGTSRKSFLSAILGGGNLPMELREAGTLASNLWARLKGASVFRVHEVGPVKRALQTWEAISAEGAL